MSTNLKYLATEVWETMYRNTCTMFLHTLDGAETVRDNFRSSEVGCYIDRVGK